MKTRIKKIEYSNGDVKYIAQIKKFGYEIGGFSHQIITLDWWFYLIPIIGQIAFFGVILTFFWQSYDIEFESLDSAKIKIDGFLQQYDALIQKKHKITKVKTSYIDYP